MTPRDVRTARYTVSLRTDAYDAHYEPVELCNRDWSPAPLELVREKCVAHELYARVLDERGEVVLLVFPDGSTRPATAYTPAARL